MFSCKEYEKHEITESILDLPLDTISSELWFKELMAVNTRNILGLNSKLCLISPNESYLTYFIDENNASELGYIGNVGEGPDDMQPWPLYAGKSLNNDTIYLFDFNTRKLKAYQVLDSNNGKPILKMSYTKTIKNTLIGKYSSSYMAICKLQNGYFVGINFLNASDKFFTLLDKDLNYIKEFGEQPLSGLATKGEIKKFTSFDGSLYSYGNSIYYAANKFGYITKYEINDNGDIKHQWTNIYSKISYEVVRGNSIRFNGETNLHGFSDIALSKDYIFATYSGIPTGEMHKKRSVNAISAKTLVVLNHNGKVLKRFKLNAPSFTIGLSNDEQFLYVMNIHPEVQLERIKVSEIEKIIKK